MEVHHLSLCHFSMVKIPIVVPRQAKFQEHINDHQLEFVHAVEERQKNVIGIYDISELEKVIKNYKKIAEKEIFQVEAIIKNLMKSLARLLKNAWEIYESTSIDVYL